MDVEQVHVAAYGKAVLDADQRDPAALGVYAPDIGGGERQSDPVGIVDVRHLADGRVLDEGVGDRASVAGLAALALHHENDEERRIQSALLHARQVHLLAGRLRPRRIVGLRAEVRRDVHVGIDGDHPIVDGPGAFQQLRLAVRAGCACK